jgi:hypothetical protein
MLPSTARYQEMVRRCELQEEDIEQERPATDLLRQRLGADNDGGDGVPHRHMGRDVDLLGSMAHGPPNHLVHQRIDVADEAERPEEGRDQDDGAGGDGEDGDDGRRQRPEGHQRDRTLIGALILGDDQGAEEDEAGHQRAHGEDDDAQVEEGMRLQRHVGGEHDARIALQHNHVDQDRAAQHQGIGDPCQPRRRQPRVQQHGGREIQKRHLEEDDPHQQHVQAVGGQPVTALTLINNSAGRWIFSPVSGQVRKPLFAAMIRLPYFSTT